LIPSCFYEGKAESTMSCSNKLLPLLILLTGLMILPFSVHAQQTLSDRALIAAIQQGGYNLYLRHEATDWSQQDTVDQKDDWLSCDGSRIRQLSEQGRQRAKRTGQAMRSLNIPVSEVLASPYCRTMETARQLGLGNVQPSNAVINMRVADYFGGREAVIATARELLSRWPASGSNRVIVAHGNVAQAATPVYPDEGEVVIFKPEGNKQFTFVGRISSDQLLALSQAN
jgi:phosphohistidine phosphatase SixA